MNFKTTANHIDVLIHFYTSPTDHPRWSADAIRQATQDWVDVEMLEWCTESDTYVCTERGLLHVLQILRLPFPKMIWVDAQGKALPMGGTIA